MPKGFVIRPYPHDYYRVEDFLDQGIVAIGWPHIGDLDGLSRDNIKCLLKQQYNYESEQALGQAAGTIYRFATLPQPGDLVIMPDGPVAYIGRVKSSYRYDLEKDNDHEGYCHQLPVEWQVDGRAIKRTSLPGIIFDSLKGQQTFFETDADLLQDTLERRRHLFAATDYPKLKREYLKRLQAGNIQNINASTFEDSVRVALSPHFPGLRRLSTVNSREGDTDLLTELPGGVTVRVQVKHFYTSGDPLTESVVDQLANSMDIGDQGIVVTSGDVGQDARRRAERLTEKGKHIGFIDGEEFTRLVFERLDSYSDDDLELLGLSRRVLLS